MVFVSKHIRYALSPDLADHMARTWKVGVPYEKPVYILEFVNQDTQIKVTEIEGDTFCGRVTEMVL